tara:strand:+ start:1158 stop:1328 length:171 start_codon:yes stop_codon:yes gene_type:complete
MAEEKYRIEEVGDMFKAYIATRGGWTFLGRFPTESGAKEIVDSWIYKAENSPLFRK